MTDMPGTPRLFARLRASPLAVRLALLCALVTAIVAGTAFAVLSSRTDADVSRVFIRELGATQRAYKAMQIRNRQLLLATAVSASTSQSFRAALGAYRDETKSGAAPRDLLRATIQREVDRIFTQLETDLLVVTDDHGRVVAARGRNGQPEFGDTLAGVPVVRYALEAEQPVRDSSFGVFRAGTLPLQIGCVAILLDGVPIGTLILGEQLRKSMPQPELDDTRAIVTAGGTVIASTVTQMPAGSRWNAAAPADTSTRRITLGGAEFVAATLPLGFTEDAQPAALYLMRPLSGALRPIERSLSQRFLIAGILAVLFVGVGVVLVSRAALNPLTRLVNIMRAGTEPGAIAYARFDGPQPAADVGTLTQAYNQLIDSLSQHHDQLEQRSAELAVTNDTLRAEVSERERAEEALRQSADLLRQSQKLESLGTLAGGVAHDFNNLLSVILGYADMLIANAAVEGRAQKDIGQIRSAAERASELVKQLLAFSRKQILQPQIVDLNRIISDMQLLLRPLIGADIHITTNLEPGLARVLADPGQIEQVIVNLIVNARDAMPTGGAIIIETANVMPRLNGIVGAQPSAGEPMVRLSVRDTGFGMDDATTSRVFEPFFTTKPSGQGTGLGLSTVYGIVRQSGGDITVSSEPGVGSTFNCLFPASKDTRRLTPARGLTPESRRGSETVLVAEDEPALRALVCRSLLDRGYTVLEAANGQEALDVAARYDAPIHVLLTDVVMPMMSGHVLAARLKLLRPAVRTIFTSGYSSDAIEQHGMLAPDSMFLQKPVLPTAVAHAVREILDAVDATEPA